MKDLAALANGLGIRNLRGIPFDSCSVKKQYLINRLGFVPASVYVGIIPYYSAEVQQLHPTVSLYAVPRDYHLFAQDAADKLVTAAEKLYPGKHFALFCDHSPIDEVLTAAKAGLGVIGRNGLLITEDYSSFVFICEIFTDIEPDTVPVTPGSCENCGLCAKACPVGLDKQKCLSLLSQKKGELSEEEKGLLKSNKCVWGCDICQLVCPHTAVAEKRGTLHDVPSFFRKNLIPVPDEKTITDVCDFESRAYSWRGTDTIGRNLSLQTESTDKGDKT